MYINSRILKHYRGLEISAKQLFADCNGDSELAEPSPKNSKSSQLVTLMQIL